VDVPNLQVPSVEEQPLPGRAYPRFSEEAPEAAFGEPVAAGLERAAQVGVAEQAYHKRQNDELRVIGAITQLSAGHDALLYGQNGEGGAFRMRGADAINMPAKFLPGYDDLASKISGSLTPDQQQMFQRHVASTRNELTLQLSRYEFQESERLAQQTFKAGQDQAVSSAALNYRDPHILQKSVLDLHALNTMEAQREGWTPIEQHQALVGSIARMHAGVIDAMLGDKDAVGARDYFEQHREELKEFDPKIADQVEKQVKAGLVQQAGDSILSTYANQGNQAGATALQNISQEGGYTPIEQAQIGALVQHGLVERAGALQQDPRNQAQIRFVDDAISGKNPSPQAMGTLDSLVRRGVFTFQQGEAKRDELMRAQRGQGQEQADLQWAMDAYNNGQHMDPLLDKKPVNLMFSVLSMGQKFGSDEFNHTAMAVMDRVGVLPDAAVSWGRTALTSGNPDEAARAARFFSAADRESNAAYEYAVDQRSRSMAYGINQGVSAGGDPEGIVQRERDIAQKFTENADYRKQLDTAWSKLKPHGGTYEQLDRDVIRNALAGDPNYTTTTWLGTHPASSVPDLPPGMLGEFGANMKQYFYLRNGNAQEARDLAIADLKRTWGVTDVNGRRELMKYAPNRMFPGLETSDIRADMDAAGVGDGRLVEFPGTGPSQGRDWWVEKPDAMGAWTPVLDKDGMPRTYTLPTGTQIDINRRADYMREASERRDAYQAKVESEKQARIRENEAAEEGGVAPRGMPHF
jgi:hypothetical protein